MTAHQRITTPRIDWSQWPSWPLRLERWVKTPFARDCLQSIADEAEDKDEAVYWAAQAAADGCAASLRELREIFAEPEFGDPDDLPTLKQVRAYHDPKAERTFIPFGGGA